MSKELREQVQASLGSAYELKGELTGGGMSRVFLAREPALGRDVVVKVLHPDLVSGASMDRFKREIQLAAQLQHPHIVPVLAAGEVDGLPYLTMPFVEGKSLRQRLIERESLPVDEAVDILRDVARALAFAHGRGVIHRDIKPDNVLLAEGSATVTDFGVAKAVTAARADVPGGTLTSVGTSIGTPTYMAPEQAAGDPSTDHRADIYAWGIMAYELIAGAPPFRAGATHKLLAAHMTETPEPLTDHRPDCPKELADLVAHCLAKDPDARPQSANDLLRAIADVRTPSGGGHETLPAISVATRRTLVRALGIYAAAFLIVAALAQAAVVLIGLPPWVLPGTLVVMALGLPVVLFTAFVSHGSRVARTMAGANSTMTRIAVRASPHVTWSRAAWGGGIAVGAFALLVVGYMTLRAFGIGSAGSLAGRGVIEEHDRILVADFDSPPNDTSLGGVVSEGIRTGLGQSTKYGVMAVSEVASALRRMQLSPNAHVDLATARQIAEREGIKAIVGGRVRPIATSYIITAELYATTDSTPIASYQETAKDAAEIIATVDRATRRVREKIGDSFKNVRATPSLLRVTTSSLPALKKYTEGFRRNAIERDFPGAIAALEEAVAIDSTFAMAMRQLSLVYGNAGLRPGRSDTLAAQAYRYRARLPEIEAGLVEAQYFNRGPAFDRPKVIAAYRRVLAADPLNPSAINNLALQLLGRRDVSTADSLLTVERKIRPDIQFGFTNGIPTLVSRGQLAAARKTLEEGRALHPDNGQIALLEHVILVAEQGVLSDSARKVCQTLTSARDAQVREAASICLRQLAVVRGRIHEAESHRARTLSERQRRGAQTSSVTSALDSAAILTWWNEQPREALALLDRTFARPLRELPDRPYLTLAQLYAQAGAPEKAKAILKQYDEDIPDGRQRRLDFQVRAAVESEIALAEHRFQDALRFAQRSDSTYDGGLNACSSCAAISRARAYDLAGDTDKAIEAFEAYLSAKWSGRLAIDAQYLAGAYKRLGELYDAKGDRQRAIANLEKFVELWKDADPELQPKVADARKRLERLRATGG